MICIIFANVVNIFETPSNNGAKMEKLANLAVAINKA